MEKKERKKKERKEKKREEKKKNPAVKAVLYHIYIIVPRNLAVNTQYNAAVQILIELLCRRYN